MQRVRGTAAHHEGGCGQLFRGVLRLPIVFKYFQLFGALLVGGDGVGGFRRGFGGNLQVRDLNLRELLIFIALLFGLLFLGRLLLFNVFPQLVEFLLHLVGRHHTSGHPPVAHFFNGLDDAVVIHRGIRLHHRPEQQL